MSQEANSAASGIYPSSSSSSDDDDGGSFSDLYPSSSSSSDDDDGGSFSDLMEEYMWEWFAGDPVKQEIEAQIMEELLRAAGASRAELRQFAAYREKARVQAEALRRKVAAHRKAMRKRKMRRATRREAARVHGPAADGHFRVHGRAAGRVLPGARPPEQPGPRRRRRLTTSAVWGDAPEEVSEEALKKKRKAEAIASTSSKDGHFRVHGRAAGRVPLGARPPEQPGRRRRRLRTSAVWGDETELEGYFGGGKTYLASCKKLEANAEGGHGGNDGQMDICTGRLVDGTAANPKRLRFSKPGDGSDELSYLSSCKKREADAEGGHGGNDGQMDICTGRLVDGTAANPKRLRFWKPGDGSDEVSYGKLV